MIHLTPTEYRAAKTLAHSALVAFTSKNRDTLFEVVAQALENKDRAAQEGRSGAVVSSWVALAHSTRCMARGHQDTANEARSAFHGCLESAKREARA